MGFLCSAFSLLFGEYSRVFEATFLDYMKVFTKLPVFSKAASYCQTNSSVGGFGLPSEKYTLYSLAVESGDYEGNLGYSIFQMLPTIESFSKHGMFRINKYDQASSVSQQGEDLKEKDN